MLACCEGFQNNFQVVEGGLIASILCAQAYASPEAAVLTRIFTLLLEDYLNETAYDAELAGLSYSIRSTVSGFLVLFYGHDSSLAASCLLRDTQVCVLHSTLQSATCAWTVCPDSVKQQVIVPEEWGLLPS